MTREIFRDLEGGAKDALRLYAAMIVTPFSVAKTLVMRTRVLPSKHIRGGKRAPSAPGDTRLH